jgi:hypothetical protein
LHEILKDPSLTADQRRESLANCDKDPRVKDAHPRIEHFLAFLVTMAAAGYRPGKVTFSETVLEQALLEHYVWEG